MRPFSPTAVTARAWYQRLLSTSRPDAAEARLVNLLAELDPADISPTAVSAIFADECVSGTEVRARLRGLWQRTLDGFLADEQLTPDELQYLERLRVALNISARDVDAVRSESATAIYRQKAASAAADGVLSAAERRELDALAARLGLNEADASTIYGAEAGKAVSEVLTGFVRDGRYSPAEEAHLQAMATRLGATQGLTTDPATQATLDRARLLWEVENGRLPEQPVPINLRRGEVCHLSFTSGWHEERTRTVRVDYAGIGTRVRICKGVYFRAGTVAPRRVTATELQQIDVGTVYITNKRVLFDGARVNKSVPLTSMIGIEVYADAVQLEKASGKSPYLVFGGDVELVATMLTGALALS